MVATTEDKKKYKLTLKQVDKTVDSPCIQVCTYDEEEEFCIGCYRTKPVSYTHLTLPTNREV